MHTNKLFLIWRRLAVVPLLLVSGCAMQSQLGAKSTSELPPLSAQSSVPLPPGPSEQQRRVEMLLQTLDSELADLLNLLPAPTPSTSAPKR